MAELTRRRFLHGGTLLAGAAMTGLGGRRSFADEWSFTLYNGQHAQTTSALVAGFLESTGIAVTVRNGTSAQLASQIMEEGTRSPADVFFSEESPPLVSLAEKGLLAPIDAATLAEVPPVYAARDGTWLGVSARCRVVAYNTGLAKKEDMPDSLLGFASDAWKGRIGYSPTSGAFQEQIVGVVLLKGHQAALDWLEWLRDNGVAYNTNSAAMKAVEDGRLAAALINNYYWFSLAAERGAANMKSALHYIRGKDPGAMLTVSAVGILKTAKSPEAAQQFVAYMVSEEGQAIIAKAMAEYPVRPGIVSPYALEPLERLEAPDITPADIGDAAEADALRREAGLS